MKYCAYQVRSGPYAGEVFRDPIPLDTPGWYSVLLGEERAERDIRVVHLAASDDALASMVNRRWSGKTARSS